MSTTKQCEVFITPAYSPVRDIAFRWGGQAPKPEQCTNDATKQVAEKDHDGVSKEGQMLMCDECYQQFLLLDARPHKASDV